MSDGTSIFAESNVSAWGAYMRRALFGPHQQGGQGMDFDLSHFSTKKSRKACSSFGGSPKAAQAALNNLAKFAWEADEFADAAWQARLNSCICSLPTKLKSTRPWPVVLLMRVPTSQPARAKRSTSRLKVATFWTVGLVLMPFKESIGVSLTQAELEALVGFKADDHIHFVDATRKMDVLVKRKAEVAA